MNRRGFMSELRSLLSFLDENDRALVLRKYDALFDKAGAEGEEELIASFGSPVRQVLQVEKKLKDEPEWFADCAEEALPEKTDESDLTQDEEQTVSEQPEYGEELSETSEVVTEEEAAEEDIAIAAEYEEPVSEEAAAEAAEPEEAAEEEFIAEQYPEPEMPSEDLEDEPEMDAGPGAGRIIGAVLVSLPMAVFIIAGFTVFLALGLSFICGGIGCGAAGVYFARYALGGLLTFMPDILLVSGLMLVMFCLALLFLWLGIWIALGGCTVTVRAAAAVYRSILKKERRA